MTVRSRRRFIFGGRAVLEYLVDIFQGINNSGWGCNSMETSVFEKGWTLFLIHREFKLWC